VIAAVRPRAPTDGETALITALEASPVRGSARARELVRDTGLPTRRVEAWRWSDLRQALGTDVALPKPSNAEDTRFRDAGLFAPAGDVIAELAIGFGRERFVKVAAGESLTLVEELDGEGFDPRFTAIEVGEGATLTRIVTQTGSGIALSSAGVRVAKSGRYQQFVLAEGAKLARIETHVAIEGEGSEVTLNGVYLARAGRHADLTSTVLHKAPACATRQLIKGVAFKGGRGVFQGKIVVEREAQRTDARQHHQGMLLEDGAEIFAKPELMIYADDVQCAHGNTAGGIDETSLFYLRARGVPEREARALLVSAFIYDAVPDFLDAKAREIVEGRVRMALGTSS
jgi:Fe-S cluster assembly protein SufD